MSQGSAQLQTLSDQIIFRASQMVDLIDRTTHPWSAVLLAVHCLCSSAVSRTGYSPLLVLYAVELSRLLAPGGDPLYFPGRLVDAAVITLRQLWLGIVESPCEEMNVEPFNSARFLVDLYAFGFVDDERMIECLEWLVNDTGFESIERMECLEVLLERLREVAIWGRSLPLDFVRHKLWPNVVSAWKDGLEKMSRRLGDYGARRFTAFAEFHDELFTAPLRKLRVRLLTVSRILADLSGFATKSTDSQLPEVDGLASILDTHAELTCSSTWFQLMEHLMNVPPKSKEVVLDDALDENSVYLAQMHRMLRKSKIY